MKKTFYATVAGAAAIGLLTQFASVKSYAASATGHAIQTVIAAISIANVSDLDFGSAAPGDAAKTVAPGNSETAENGSFTVSGEPNTAYTITLPADGAVMMTTGSGSTPDEQIAVDGFVSFPAANGTIGVGGTEELYVGATRAALGASQVPGAYSGDYTVTVVY